jgi:predicted O-methyltransferase YrrM
MYGGNGSAGVVDRVLRHQLADVPGWLLGAEAIELYLHASRVHDGDIVEIGSYLGRSTICLALGAQAGRSPRVLAIDPLGATDGQRERLEGNLERAGVRNAVEIVEATSHAARHRVPDRTVGLLFVDGSHTYDDVVQDVVDWTPALVPGAVAAFNDVYWSDVSRALRDTIARPGSPFRRPRWADQTLFCDYKPDAPWGAADALLAWRLRLFLKSGRVWWRWHEANSAHRTRTAAVALRTIIVLLSVALPVARRRIAAF